MKIAFLSFYSGEYYRGVETYVHFLANELVNLGHDVVVYQNGPHVKNSVYKVVTLGMKVDWSKKGNESKRIINIFTNYWMQIVGKFTRKVLKQVDHDVDLVIPTNGNLQSIYCRIWCTLHKKKMLITGLSGPGWDDRFNVWCFPDVFIGATEYQTRWAKNVNPFVKTVTIPYGVSLDKFARTVKKMDLDLPRPIILSVGAFVPIKRHHLTIEAVSRLKKGSLVIAGSKGESENELQKLGNEKLPNRFKLMTISHDQIPPLYRSGDLFVFPTSPWESFGIVLVEAMASGLPVVANDDPIRREIVGDVGLFVDPTDINSYTKAIEKALTIKWDNKPRRQAEKFGWDRIAREYDKLFRELLR
jgi:glycosyltransferase involved in cell wall biosynthesis